MLSGAIEYFKKKYVFNDTICFLSLTKEDVVMGMLKNFEMAKEDETAQEKWKMAKKLKRQVNHFQLQSYNVTQHSLIPKFISNFN